MRRKMSTSLITSYQISMASAAAVPDTFFLQDDQVDMQPLDLRVRPIREEQMLKQDKDLRIHPIRKEQILKHDHPIREEQILKQCQHPMGDERILKQGNHPMRSEQDRKIYPIRKEHILKRDQPMSGELMLKQNLSVGHKSECLGKTCSLGNTKTLITSVYPHLAKADTSSPGLGLTVSLLSCSDPHSHFYTQHQAYGTRYCLSGSHTDTSRSYLPSLPPARSVEGPSFQHSSVSNSELNLISAPSDMLSYLHHSDSNSPKEVQTPWSRALAQKPVCEEEDEEPTYMDLDASTLKQLSAKSSNDYSGQGSSFVYSTKTASEIPCLQHRITEDKVKTACGPRLSPALHGPSSRKGNDSSETRSECVASHTWRNKSLKGVPYTTRASPSSQRATHVRQRPQQQQQQRKQMCLPDSSSSPDNVLSSVATRWTFQNVSFSNYSTSDINLQLLSDNKQPSSSVETCIYSSASGLENGRQSLSPSNEHVHQDKPGGKSPSDMEITSRNKSTIYRSPSIATADCLPVSTSPRDNNITGNRHKRTRDDTNVSCANTPPSGAPETKENSPGINILDFWISKVLLERSVEASPPRKPCNVDYFCTPSGEKKIRLRLIDLIELQVEQSLKA